MAAAPGPSSSDAVNRILARADAGITAIESTTTIGGILLSLLPDWSSQLLTTILRPADTRVQVIGQLSDQTTQTTCLRSDFFLLEEKMAKVQRKLNGALAQKNLGQFLLFTDLFHFLEEQYQKLLAGNNDPAAKDAAWQTPRTFDADPATLQTDGDLCYFHSNYLPPSLSGYGCDTQALQQSLDGLNQIQAGQYDTMRSVLTEDRDAMQLVQTTDEQYLQNTQSLAQLQQTIDATVSGEASSVPVAPAPRKHLQLAGCQQTVPSDIVFFAPRGNDSLDQDPIRIVKEVSNLKKTQEANRPIPGDNASSAPRSLLTIFADQIRTDLHSLGQTQARQESNTFIIAADPGLSVEQALGSLQAGVGELSALSQKIDGGLRGFVRDFTAFLLKSCTDRPCNERLNRILKIVFQDACFPYTSGAYLQDTSQNPRWKICADAAGIAP